MRPVRILPDDLADQIAAGEVVERPASVVKELVENAIDAGARTIKVEIEGGGIALVRVSDDGHGMREDDARLAVRRHATSKIAAREDLERIATLGFRGEALPSIASVSRFSLTSRTRDAVAGTEVRIEGGTEPEVREIGCAPGTTVTVRDLFFNVPARRKFLKAVGTESAHVREALVRAALADASLRLTLVRDGRVALELLPTSELGKRASLLFPEESLARIEGVRDAIEIEAFLSAPERARNGAAQLHLYVNGRPVRDRALARAVAFAYGSVLPAGRYPVGVVYVRIAPERVDVNVHPQKAEVRFDDARAVLDAITRVLAQGLGTSPFRGPSSRGADFWAQRLGVGPKEESAAESDPWGLAAPEAPAPPPPPSTPLPYSALGALTSRASEGPSLLPKPGFFGALRVVGQVARTYVVCEAHDGLYVLDQHAADERVRFDRLRAQHESREIAMQRLLIPERVEVAPSEATLVEERAETLLALGLEVARIGDTTLAVHAVPALVKRAAPERLVRDVLAQLAMSGERAFGDAIDTAIATMACHGAIRAGDTLSPRECEELLRALDRVGDFARHCPHGRPVAYEISFLELARRVGR
ncbi:DNA mismatch repair endonuclease MutL [Sandaracinus amylolyticus]|uniref:DNA mismatch repair endonuclease MutL n=1 Tax=Sandaracinus amylolyticus TaxID=927083 RepID=UPI001F017B73|nr:DNA mismatch repair endonuclease MutL [Sandaracinus amylolyticus]UJR79398.1 DNA mismatch repair endonuclease MutL [Sandaracinus amylolyticus]